MARRVPRGTGAPHRQSRTRHDPLHVRRTAVQSAVHPDEWPRGRGRFALTCGTGCPGRVRAARRPSTSRQDPHPQIHPFVHSACGLMSHEPMADADGHPSLWTAPGPVRAVGRPSREARGAERPAASCDARSRHERTHDDERCAAHPTFRQHRTRAGRARGDRDRHPVAHDTPGGTTRRRAAQGPSLKDSSPSAVAHRSVDPQPLGRNYTSDVQAPEPPVSTGPGPRGSAELPRKEERAPAAPTPSHTPAEIRPTRAR
jgi:hypothetical protein